VTGQSVLDVPGGCLAYSDAGAGPLVIAVPGMGDLRSTYRFLAPKLVAAGYRVISLDLRGHGKSSVRWDDYSVGAVASDILALVAALDAGPAHVIGNSMAAGAAVIAAARKPKAIRSLTLVGPFVRDMMPPWLVSASGLGAPRFGGCSTKNHFRRDHLTTSPPKWRGVMQV
jgi:pimeloyl-ACP methyl ester carboxylesterase